MVVLGDGCQFVIMIEAPELLHPRTFDPLPAPHCNESLFPQFLIILILFQLSKNIISQIGQIIDINLYSFAPAENCNKFIPSLNLNLLLALLQKISINYIHCSFIQTTYFILQICSQFNPFTLLHLLILIVPSTVLGTTSW